ncbi:MAG: Ni/Fe hydrogenase subunit alpha [Gemmataceae bacterium]|nr:Ni/Fe hydrogenase subunit alpha [Gemmataceae bacterium]
MPDRIVIDPVTRIEGHAKISIFLGDDGAATAARFHVTEFRGFEKMYEGRPFWEMPAITARVCGICPVSHLTASAKAGDQILAVRVPPAAVKLRRFANWAQVLQSHALSFFHLSSPDLLLGMDADPAKRNIFGLIADNPDLARAGIRLRQFGQRIIAALGGQKVHPAWVVPGGVRHALPDEDKEWVRERLPEAKQTTLAAIGLFKGLLDKFRDEAEVFGKFPSLHLGLVGPDGTWETYDGNMRFAAADGKTVAEVDPARYKEFIAERAESWSYIKSTYCKPLGPDAGMYRVGPLARLNVCDRMGTPQADRELVEFRARGREATNASFLFHLARLIEILASAERIEGMLDDPDLQSADIRAEAGVNNPEGVGCCEAPRGILFHHYHVTGDGLIREANLLIATAQNNLAMNRTVTQIARRYVTGKDVPEGILNRLEAGIRAFDPCLSCSTHAAGQMPLRVELVGPDGEVVGELRRG